MRTGQLIVAAIGMAAIVIPLAPSRSAACVPTGSSCPGDCIQETREVSRATAATTLMWTATDVSSPGGTWDSYMATAAAWTEGGYTDWRLPTVAELQAAVQNGSFGQMAANASWRLWTSEEQGHNYAWTVRVTTDANGYPIPSQSGQKEKILKRSNLRAKFVRP